MKKFVILSMLCSVVFLLSMSRIKKDANLDNTIEKIEVLYENNVKSLDSFLVEYPRYIYDSNADTRQVKYRELAYYFKRAAGGLIYFRPDNYYSNLIGPFRLELNQKRKGLLSIVPTNWLFTGPIGNEADSTLKSYSKEDSISVIAFIAEATGSYRQTLNEMDVTSHFDKMDASTLFDFLRTEIFRISSLDIANSDFIIEDAGMSSLKGSVDSWIGYMDAMMENFSANKTMMSRWNGIRKGITDKLYGSKDFNSFDRVDFIRHHLIPASVLLNEIQRALPVKFKNKWAAIKSDALHIYDKNVFNIDYFAPNKDAYYSKEKAKLGELLFFDPILSDNNERACASCHKPEKAFTDGELKATAFERQKILARNTPTVINSGLQSAQFWDLRAKSLEDQLDSVVNNPDELHSSFENVIERIKSSPEYVNMFYKAFPHTKQKGITREDVKNAIGVYERTVNGLDSRFDQYMRGDNSKLSASEINGFNVYLGKARCGTCHFAPLFNGALPPFYNITDHQSLGIPEKDTMTTYSLDPDEGLFTKTGNTFLRFAFKTPTVRNASLTSPYMHNGVYKTLEQVVNFYDHAAGIKFTKQYGKQMKGLPFFTIIPIELKLTDQEKKDLVSFIHALTDTTAAKKPSRLPELKGKYATINDRVIGGVY